MALSSEQWGNFSETKKNYQTCDEKQQCQEVKKSENEKRKEHKTQPTLLTQQIKVKREKKYRVSVHCLSFE